MTPDELMKPRYKVIAGYPSMPFMNNQVLNLVIRRTGGWVYEWYEHDGKYEIGEYELKDYPHLFKKLEWWHERREEDLPKYIGVKNEHGVFIWIHPIVKWVETRLDEVGSCIISFPDLDGIYAEREYNPWSMSPATQSEYEKMKAK
jgi:hypothetical protein